MRVVQESVGNCVGLMSFFVSVWVGAAKIYDLIYNFGNWFVI